MQPIIASLAREIGVPVNSIKKWKGRNGVPYRYRPQLVLQAQRKGVALSFDDLEWGQYGQRKARRRPKKKRAA